MRACVCVRETQREAAAGIRARQCARGLGPGGGRAGDRVRADAGEFFSFSDERAALTFRSPHAPLLSTLTDGPVGFGRLDAGAQGVLRDEERGREARGRVRVPLRFSHQKTNKKNAGLAALAFRPPRPAHSLVPPSL